MSTLRSERRLATLVNSWIAAFNAHDVERIVALLRGRCRTVRHGYEACSQGAQRDYILVYAAFPTDARRSSIPQHRRFFNEREAAICWLARGTYTDRCCGSAGSHARSRSTVSASFLVRSGLIHWQHGYYEPPRDSWNRLPKTKHTLPWKPHAIEQAKAMHIFRGCVPLSLAAFSDRSFVQLPVVSFSPS